MAIMYRVFHQKKKIGIKIYISDGWRDDVWSGFKEHLQYILSH